MASDWDKVLAGGALDSQSEEIANDRIRGQALLSRLNASPAGDHVLRQQIARAVGQLFDGYKSGLNAEDVPPLLGYEVEEKNIHERDWK